VSTVRRYLVVANLTLGGDHLLEKVRACAAKEPSQFHIVVPATPPQEGLTWSEEDARAAAQERLAEAIRRFRELGVDVDGEVGSHRPLEAIAAVLAKGDFDEIILSTLPAGASRWLGMDLPHRVERSCGLPVTHVVSRDVPVAH
jgi:GABA permease